MATIDELYQQYLLSQQPPLSGSPITLTPYQRIMAQMTPTMNPYTGAGVAIGGYDPALYGRMSGSGLINYGRGGGGGMGGSSDGGSAGDLDVGGNKNTQVESSADQSARNQKLNDVLTEFSKNGILGLALSGLNTLFGSQAPAPVDSLGTSLGGGFGSPASQGQTSSQSGEGNPGEQPGETSSDTGVGNPGEQGGGGSGSGNTSSDTGVGNPGESNYMGGLITNVFGTDPAGPDEGQVNIMRGEYVIKKSAVKKYGTGLLDMINDGKIPAKKMKSLLG